MVPNGIANAARPVYARGMFSTALALTGVTQSDIQSITVSCSPSCVSGNTVTVSSSYRYHYITPIKAIINFISAGSMPSYLTVSSSTEMRLE